MRVHVYSHIKRHFVQDAKMTVSLWYLICILGAGWLGGFACLPAVTQTPTGTPTRTPTQAPTPMPTMNPTLARLPCVGPVNTRTPCAVLATNVSYISGWWVKFAIDGDVSTGYHWMYCARLSQREKDAYPCTVDCPFVDIDPDDAFTDEMIPDECYKPGDSFWAYLLHGTGEYETWTSLEKLTTGGERWVLIPPPDYGVVT